MKIESTRVGNFRSFADETVYLNDYACLVGPNGSGKSTVLCALKTELLRLFGGAGVKYARDDVRRRRVSAACLFEIF
ncbi:AAA family ATPase [Bradyrhizobium cenepequi]|uniref:AAA family ATPase n=1 Tax=Bradyrhizobium cenepequi TaxID=2821403 RepID=UPI001CE2ECBC|nr:AAA family ATPase [Bradyrhizobium cenepequi]